MLAKAREQKEQSVKEKSKYQKITGLRANAIGRKGGQLADIEILRDSEDIRLDPKYGGQTEILLKYIPLYCVDGKSSVDVETLREWIICAIVEEDPVSQKFFDDIQKLNDLIVEIEKNIKKIPKILFLDDSGNPKPEEDCRKEREELFVRLGEELVEAETKLDTINRKLKEHIEWRRNMGIVLGLVTSDANTSTAIWKLELSGADDVEDIEDSLLAKRNWSGIKLAKGDSKADPPIPPWAGRGEVPDASNPTQTDYSEFQINMLGVRILRVPTGLGFYRQLDRQSSAIYAEDFELYYGEYLHGYKSGYGIQINDAGVYAGNFEDGGRRGQGRWDLADGTTVIGNFGVQTIYKSPPTSEFRNPYLDGEPHGQVEIFYGDGGYYRGHMVNSVIEGQGDYQSAFNELMSGNFSEGLLQGPNGFLQTSSEDCFIGNFRFGELHGHGTYLGKNGDNYDGYWDHFLRHGRGVSMIGDVGCFRGYHVNGFKHGKGSLEFGAKAESEDETDDAGNSSSAKVNQKQHSSSMEFSKYQNIYQGFFLGNELASQGNVMNIPKQKPYVLAKSNKRAVEPIVSVLREEQRSLKYSDRTMEKYCDLEHYMRKEIAAKKLKIFRQQKHFTKKMIYQEDATGYFDSSQLVAKLRLRNERLEKLKAENHTFQKAVVPRLHKINNTLFDAYTKGFNKTKSQLADIKDYEIPKDLLKIALSDLEEIRERHRFLKYDLIWQRAEDAFDNARKSTIH